MRDQSISVYFARCVLHHTVENGIDPIGLLRKSRISPRLLLEDNARISIERFADLQVDTMLAMDDEALGYGSRPMRVGCWSMMCHAVISAETLGQALSRYCRFFALLDFDHYPILEEQDDTARIAISKQENGASAAPFLTETTLFNAHRFASWLVQEHLPINVARLDYAPQTQTRDYRHMFLANPVEFEHDEASLVFSRSLLEKRVTQNEASLRHFLRHPVLMLLTQGYSNDSWTSQVRSIVRRQLNDTPELGGVAEALEVHPQTLRRRLSAEGNTFKDIKNQVRRDTALHFLGKQGLSIEEIAHRAGFSESSAFIRAFKGWTGVTPYTYRKGL